RWAAVLLGLLILALVALLDYLTPPGVNFGLIYMLAVLPVAWVAGVPAGIIVAVLATLLEGGNARIVHPDAWPVEVWNALSRLLILSALTVITDQLHRRQLDLRRVDGERRTLLRLLEREFPRPLRALDWFSRVLDESLERGTIDAARKQIKPLRHHVQETSFLATDLLSIGSLQNGTLSFDRIDMDLRQIVTEAADAALERGRSVGNMPGDPVSVLCDPNRLRHAIAIVFARCVQSPYATVPVFVRVVGADGLVQVNTMEAITEADVELAQLLISGSGGRLAVSPRNASRGVVISVFVPRSDDDRRSPTASSAV